MGENIILKKNPKIEFQFLDNGFELIDGQTERNSGFYSYNDLQSTDLNNVWFPRLAKCLKTITWILNGVPYFPDAESYKKANLIIHLRKAKLGIWLTNSYMAEKAKRIKELLDENTKHNTPS
jgi:hypothetical protein